MHLPESANARGELPAQWPRERTSLPDESVEGIVSLLEELPRRPVRDHQLVYQQIHDDLLADLETRSD